MPFTQGVAAAARSGAATVGGVMTTVASVSVLAVSAESKDLLDMIGFSMQGRRNLT
jgi:hypothetical protein